MYTVVENYSRERSWELTIHTIWIDENHCFRDYNSTEKARNHGKQAIVPVFTTIGQGENKPETENNDMHDASNSGLCVFETATLLNPRNQDRLLLWAKI
jgi:hypothetical protein